MQDMCIALQTCNVVHHTQPVVIVIADASSLIKLCISTLVLEDLMLSVHSVGNHAR
jgi:hypothetical protein